MTSFISRIISPPEPPDPPEPGVYHWMAPEDAEVPYRLHLRIEPDGRGILIVNASTVLHLNQTAMEYAKLFIEDTDPDDAASHISDRYRVRKGKAKNDFQEFVDHITTLATRPDLDPVTFFGMDRTEPFADSPAIPYRLDCALTYQLDVEGTVDPLAVRRVDKELTSDEWKKTLKDAWDIGIPHVTFTGGEPTLREDLLDLISYAESLGQVTGLLTNGSKFDDPEYIAQLEMTGIDHFLLSYDPSRPMQRVALQNALDSDVYTAVHMSITKGNQDSIISSLEELLEMGVPAISLTAASKEPEMIHTMEEARAHAAYLGMHLVWDIAAPYSAINPIAVELNEIGVGAGTAWMYIEPDGDVLPSQGIDRILGNVLKDSWEDILGSAAI